MRVPKKNFVMTFADGHKVSYKGKYYTDLGGYKLLMAQHGKITKVRWSYPNK